MSAGSLAIDAEPSRTMRGFPLLGYWLIAGAVFLFPIERLVVIGVGGFNVRPSYALMGLFLVFAWPYAVSGLAMMPAAAALLAALAISTAAATLYLAGVAYLVWALFTVLFACACLGFLRGRPWLVERLALLTVTVGTFWAGVGFAQWLASFVKRDLAYSWLDGRIPRVQALMQESSYFAVYLVPILFLAIFRNRPWHAAIVALGIAASASRTAIVGVAAGALALFAYRYTKTFVRIAAASPFVLALGAFALYSFEKLRVGLLTFALFLRDGFMLTDATSAMPRFESWAHALTIWRANPILGVGTGQYGRAYVELGLGLPWDSIDKIKTTNLFLEVGAEVGAIGAFILLWWCLHPWPKLAKYRRDPLALGLFAALIASFAMLPFIQTWWRNYLWWLWVLAYAYRHQEQLVQPEMTTGNGERILHGERQ